jgi:hypothetical protein
MKMIQAQSYGTRSDGGRGFVGIQISLLGAAKSRIATE